MRYLIISDIHANLAAFKAVLSDAPSFDRIWCLGDIAGYGPEPNECVELLNEFPHICVAGNHDWAAIGLLNLEDFNTDARHACQWTQEQLTPESLEYLKNLPTTLVEEGFTLVHGSPRQPIWEYILYSSTARSNFPYFNTQICLVGHTHAPAGFRYHVDQEGMAFCEPFNFIPRRAMSLGKDRLILNPGSVGQPRDGDARASYALLDPEEKVLEYHRVTYPVEVTQEKMKRAGLPARLIIRLSYGW